MDGSAARIASDGEVARQPAASSLWATLPATRVGVQFNGKLNGSTDAGDKEFAAVFLAGHFDRFVEKAQEPCGSVATTPFPELEKLPR